MQTENLKKIEAQLLAAIQAVYCQFGFVFFHFNLFIYIFDFKLLFFITTFELWRSFFLFSIWKYDYYVVELLLFRFRMDLMTPFLRILFLHPYINKIKIAYTCFYGTEPVRVMASHRGSAPSSTSRNVTSPADSSSD